MVFETEAEPTSPNRRHTSIIRLSLRGALVVSVLLAGLTCRSTSTCPELVGAAGLPTDLCERQLQLTELSLPATTTDLSWLRGNRLTSLKVEGAVDLKTVEHLPTSIRHLSLRSCGIESIELPENLRSLDVSNTPIKALDQLLPRRLIDLSMSEPAQGEISGLPKTLESLTLTADTPNLELEDLRPLLSLEKLRVLHLMGQAILSLEGVPETLDELSVEVNEPKFVRLPQELRSLELVGTGPSPREGMPHNLETLTLDGWQPEGWQPSDSLDALAPFLTSLTIRDVANLRALRPLPESIEELNIFLPLQAVQPLPPRLRALRLTASKLDAESISGLPETLELLSVTDYPEEELPPLPQGLHTLDLTYSGVRRLDALDSLRVLNLTGVDLEATATLPEHLETLVWQNYPGTTLREIPDSATHLDLSNSPLLTTLPALPAKLAELRLANNTALSRLPALPAELKLLDISGCENLSALTGLPKGLRTLIVSAKQLESLDGLPEKVTRLEFRDAF